MEEYLFILKVSHYLRSHSYMRFKLGQNVHLYICRWLIMFIYKPGSVAIYPIVEVIHILLYCIIWIFCTFCWFWSVMNATVVELDAHVTYSEIDMTRFSP